MNLMTITKAVVDLVVSTGVGMVIGNTIKNATPSGKNIATRFLIGTGSLVLTSLVSSVAAKHANEQIETTIDQIRELKTSVTKENI